MKAPLICSILAVASVDAMAQSATVRLQHADPDGNVLPGETVNFTLSISWQGALALQLIQGSAVAGPDIGVASNSRVPHTLLPGDPASILNPGTPSLGSVTGVHLFQGGPGWYFFGSPPPLPWGNSSGIELLNFQWTAPATLGVVGFNWVGDAAQPDPVMMRVGGILGPIPTTYLGTSLNVVPSPASALILALGPALLVSRRRR